MLTAREFALGWEVLPIFLHKIQDDRDFDPEHFLPARSKYDAAENEAPDAGEAGMSEG